jgi:hypothetical protein
MLVANPDSLHVQMGLTSVHTAWLVRVSSKNRKLVNLIVPGNHSWDFHPSHKARKHELDNVYSSEAPTEISSPAINSAQQSQSEKPGDDTLVPR